MTGSTPAGPREGAPREQGGRQQRSIKNYLIDSKFQLKYTGYIVALTVIVSGALGYFLYRSSQAVIRQGHVAVDEGKRAVEEGKHALVESKHVSDVVGMNIKEQYADSPALAEKFRHDAEEVDRKFDEQQRALEAQYRDLATQYQDLVGSQRTMLLSVVGALTALVFFIALLGIFITHKVAGPIFKMKQLLTQVGDGKLNFQHRLRKGDELQDFFEVFLNMVQKLHSRQAREVELLEAALSKVEANDGRDAVASMKSLLEEMRKSRDA